MNDQRTAIVTFATGEAYLRQFTTTFRPSVERYARSVGKPFVVITKLIRETPKHPSWQKLLIFQESSVREFDRILIVDGDIFITKHARNIFEEIGDAPWAAVQNNPYNLPTLAKTDMNLYENCPQENRPSFVVNGGMFLITREYRSALENIFETQPEQTCYEQGPLSYYLLNEGKGRILSPEFNTIVHSYIEKYGHSLSSILAMYDQASFLHFVAGKWRSVFYFIRWFDGTRLSVIKKILRRLGSEKYDPFTRTLFGFAERCIGSYLYRSKRLRAFFS
jgi:hypothetical protein